MSNEVYWCLKWNERLHIDAATVRNSEWMNVITFSHCLLSDAGYYTCVEVIFTLRRQVGFYMMGVYAPTLLIVVLSWLSFWINPDASAARVPLGMDHFDSNDQFHHLPIYRIYKYPNCYSKRGLGGENVIEGSLIFRPPWHYQSLWQFKELNL